MNTRIVELTKKFSEIKAEHEELENKLKEAATKWSEIETELLSAMIEEGVNSVDIDGLGRFSLRTRNYLSVNSANKERFFEYLKETGNDHLLKLDVNPRTLTAFLNDHLESLIQQKVSEFEGDTVAAREKMLAFLNEKGASYFTKRDIAMQSKRRGSS
jgi:deoxyribodipyrimidine photolyase